MKIRDYEKDTACQRKNSNLWKKIPILWPTDFCLFICLFDLFFYCLWINRMSMRSSFAMLWSPLSLRHSPVLTCSGWGLHTCLQRVALPREKMTQNYSAQQVSTCMQDAVIRRHFAKPFWQKHNLSPSRHCPHLMISCLKGFGITTWENVVCLISLIFSACKPV